MNSMHDGSMASADTPVMPPLSLTRALQLAAAGVAAVTFTLSFYGLNDFAGRSMGLPAPLSWLVPLGLDGLTLVGIASTFMLRQVRLHVRAYAWAVFGVAAGLSMAGNHQHAVTRHLDAGGAVGFTAAPVILALAAHLLVVTWRNLERPTDPPATGSGRAAVAGVTNSHRPATPQPPVTPVTDRDEARLCREAARLRSAGTPWREIAAHQKVSESTVRRRVKRGPSDSPPAPTDTPTLRAVNDSND
jgi:HAMP domain-containing protein